MTTINIMLDTETWGTTPGSDIRSIGACLFAPETGLVHDGSLGTMVPFYRACDNPLSGSYSPDHYTQAQLNEIGGPYRRYNLTRDPETVQWWSDQSAEAQAAFAEPVDLKQALIEFYLWLTVAVGDTIMGEQVKCRIWSHGANFDPPIVEAAWRACNPMPELTSPWHYRSPRDTRTIFDVAGIADHSDWLNQHPGPLGIQHHALDDAICQARAVCAAMSRIAVVADDHR